MISRNDSLQLKPKTVPSKNGFAFSSHTHHCLTLKNKVHATQENAVLHQGFKLQDEEQILVTFWALAYG